MKVNPSQASVVEAHGDLTKRGSEYVGACRLCGGDDRFYVRKDGRFFCRQCLPDGKNRARYVEHLKALGLAEDRLPPPSPEWYTNRDRQAAKAEQRKRATGPDCLDLAIADGVKAGRHPTVELTPAQALALQTHRALKDVSAGIRNGALTALRDLVPALDEALEAAKPTTEDEENILIAEVERSPRTALRTLVKQGKRVLKEADEPFLKTLGQLRTELEPAIDWLVEGLLPADGLSLVVAPPKVGKSTLARCLAVSVASGGEWLGKTVTQGAVVHLVLEERTATVRGHYDRIGAPDDGIHLLVSPAPPPPDRPTMLRGCLEEVRPALVIIDPLQRWIRISDGNAYSEATEAMTPLIALAREYGTHFLLVHHSRKGGGEHGTEVLGSTAFAGSVDTTISLTLEKGRRLFYALGRDAVSIQKTVLTIDDRGWVDIGETKREADQTDKADEILAFLKGQGEAVTEKEIMLAVPGDRGQKQRALRSLVADRMAHRYGEGKKGDPYRYAFVVSGLDP